MGYHSKRYVAPSFLISWMFTMKLWKCKQLSLCFVGYWCMLCLLWAAESFYSTGVGKGVESISMYHLTMSLFLAPYLIIHNGYLAKLGLQVEQIPLPLLFMRTVLQAIGIFPSLVSCNYFIINLGILGKVSSIWFVLYKFYLLRLAMLICWNLVNNWYIMFVYFIREYLKKSLLGGLCSE